MVPTSLSRSSFSPSLAASGGASALAPDPQADVRESTAPEAVLIDGREIDAEALLEEVDAQLAAHGVPSADRSLVGGWLRFMAPGSSYETYEDVVDAAITALNASTGSSYPRVDELPQPRESGQGFTRLFGATAALLLFASGTRASAAPLTPIQTATASDSCSPRTDVFSALTQCPPLSSARPTLLPSPYAGASRALVHANSDEAQALQECSNDNPILDQLLHEVQDNCKGAVIVVQPPGPMPEGVLCGFQRPVSDARLKRSLTRGTVQCARKENYDSTAFAHEFQHALNACSVTIDTHIKQLMGELRAYATSCAVAAIEKREGRPPSDGPISELLIQGFDMLLKDKSWGPSNPLHAHLVKSYGARPEQLATLEKFAWLQATRFDAMRCHGAFAYK